MDPGEVLNLGSFQDNTSLQANTISNDGIRSNNYIGTNTASLSNLGRRMNHNVALMNIIQSRVDKLLGELLGQMRKVQTGTGQEILGLTDVHPETIQVEGVKLTILGNEGEDFLLNGGGLELR
jgi:hypothetical protein